MMDVRRLIWLSALGLLTAACSSLSDNPPHRQVNDFPLSAPVAVAPSAVTLIDLARQPALSSYLQDIRQHNHQLKALQATVQAYEQAALAQAGTTRPQANLILSGQRGKTPPLSATSQWSATLNASWALDIWGKIANETDAARLLVTQQEANYQQALQALLAQGMQLWIEQWRIQETTRITQERLDTMHTLQTAVEEGYRQGHNTYLEWVSLQQEASLLQDALIQLQSNQKTTQYQLNLLRGRTPDTPINTRGILPTSPALPDELPASVLANRPDLQAAFAYYQAQDKAAQAATKALLPQLDLNLMLGNSSTALGDLLSGQTLWQLLGNLTQPLLSGNQLRAQAKRSSREAESALYEYEHQVLKALEEVYSTLSQDSALRQQLIQSGLRLKKAAQQLDTQQNAYRLGTALLQDYLAAKDHLLQTQADATALNASYLSNRVQLALVLGHNLNTQGN